MTLEIEVGKFYRTRDGRKVGPMERNEKYSISGAHAFKAPDLPDSPYVAEFYADGRLFATGKDRGDLIAEWDEARGVLSPARKHFTDLTAIDCPFGELDDDTQSRLRAWPHGWECRQHLPDFRSTVGPPMWWHDMIYRALSAPVKEVGTLAEIGAQVGDVVEYQRIRFDVVEVAASGNGRFSLRRVDRNQLESWDGDDNTWRIIRRASDAKPAPQGLVITETVKRIVPGVYGRVRVSNAMTDASDTCIELMGGIAFSAPELRAAIATLTEIADALEGGAK